MTLHWWMHWFWVTLIYSVVAHPLLPSSTFSIPLHEGIHSIQPPLNSPPTAPGADLPASLGHEHSGSKPTLSEKVAAEIVADSPSIAVQHGDYGRDSTEKSVIGEDHHFAGGEQDGHDDYGSVSEPSREVPLFLEEEGERGWGLEDRAPRPPYFLQSSELGELYEAERENEELHASDGMPWLPPAIPPAEAESSLHSIILPSHNPPPSASEEPRPSDQSSPDSSAAPTHEDAFVEEEGGPRGPRDQSQQLTSTPSPEANVDPEGVTPSPSPLWNLFSSTPPSYVVTPSPSPLPIIFYGSSPAPVIPSSDPSSSPEHSEVPPTPSPSPSASPEALPPSPSDPVPSSDPPLAEPVRGREGKAIGISHVDQQPKQEQKPTEGPAIAEDPTGPTTVMPTKLNVDSSPEKSSSSLNMSVSIEKEDQADVGSISIDPKDPVLADSSNANDNDKRDSKEEQSSEVNSSSVIKEDAGKVVEPKVVIGPKLQKDVDAKNDDSSGPSDKSVSGQGKPTQEEDLTPPVEVPTAVAVREGGVSGENVQPEEKNTGGGEVETPNDKVGKESATTVVDVQSTVQQGRMTAPKALDAASIVGISLGSVLLVGAIAGGVGFVLYRRSLYANKPQTLNDKCSNPDSSGYIDDTLRENSEEMYSLDNDSFLNSLEAMTIQNYWTDSVKHTKL